MKIGLAFSTVRIRGCKKGQSGIVLQIMVHHLPESREWFKQETLWQAESKLCQIKDSRDSFLTQTMLSASYRCRSLEHRATQ